MDSITQAVLGAAIGEAMLGKKAGSKGAIAGAIIATIPDLDVALYLVYDSYDMLSIHRGISHSIVFSIVASFLIAFILSKIKGFRNYKIKTLVLFSWLTLFTHALLDTFTAYGTQLLLPFSNKRLGFDSVNVVDPLYTIPLILGLIWSLWFYKSKPQRSIFNTWGLVLSSLYLVGTLINKERVRSIFEDKLAAENIEYSTLLTMPVGIANLNWYGVAKGKDSIYMQKYALFDVMSQPFEAFPIHEDYLSEVNKEAAETMRWFAKGFYTVEKEKDRIRVYNLQVDMRGTIQNGDKRAPTHGYFELSTQKDEIDMTSGSIKK